MMRKHQLNLLLLCLLSCKDPVTPSPHPDDKDPVQSCAAAEKNLLQLECKDSAGAPLGGPNRRGKPFRDVCLEALANKLSLRPVCLAGVRSCSDVKKCEENR